MSRKKQYQGARGGFCLVFAAAILASMGWYWGGFYAQGFRPFMQYETAQGLILDAGQSRCGRRKQTEQWVRYQYTVKGIVYHGDRYVLGDQCGSIDQTPLYLGDNRVLVYYSVKRPAFSVLIRRWGNGTILITLMAASLFAGSLYGWVVATRKA
ncbi:hypothetical protein G4G28_18375 [Massilia sp. Dwa41.01b]|uniref:DUF3592 domain-containing protein n=1 Tax=unclassified Massilia TaxID=2609279 RepID=UPI0015FFD600|nr:MULTISPECIES: DUF3592 domain-containing protein [unclassified Massilia]QNA89974.1 hypothetical protein G4G28_18375 [Massilia sp. Dwa41.01b]QNB00858.1 hypothetical protein G4G31_21950 [Massilia sp. Se16.2.3]